MSITGSMLVNAYVVSILVFVELALDATEEPPRAVDRLGFNPCFRGTCS